MRVRALRQAGLAVVPMVLLSQCAPQCTPATPSPPAMAFYDLTASLPPNVSVADITRDGRFVSYNGAFGDTYRLDLNTWQADGIDGGMLIGDGWGVVDAWDETSVAVYEFLSGAAVGVAGLPAGWELEAIDSASGDGFRVGVTAVNGALADVAAFMLDLRTGEAIRLDEPLPGAGSTATASYGALVSADGQTAAFSYRDGPVGCMACVDAWAFRSGGPVLVSPTPSGGTSATGDGESLDVSVDGRFILFHSTASDLALDGGRTGRPPQDHLYIRDVVAGTTTDIAGIDSVGYGSSISDDGTKVALVVTRPAGNRGPRSFAAVYDRNTHQTTVLTPMDVDHMLSSSNIAISANGGRFAFDVWASGNVRHIVVDVSY